MKEKGKQGKQTENHSVTRQKGKQGKQTKKSLFRGNTRKHETRQKYLVSQKPDKSNDMKIRMLDWKDMARDDVAEDKGRRRHYIRYIQGKGGTVGNNQGKWEHTEMTWDRHFQNKQETQEPLTRDMTDLVIVAVKIIYIYIYIHLYVEGEGEREYITTVQFMAWSVFLV